MYEIYQFSNSRKTCLVFEPGIHGADMRRLANYHYKVRKDRIVIQRAYLYNGELYFKDPDAKNSKLCWIAFVGNEVTI